MSLAIDEHEKPDYCDFSQESLNVFQLSEYQLVFSGTTKEQNGWEPEWAKYAPYSMDIHEPASFPVIPETLLTPGQPLNYRNIHMTDVFWRHFVPYKDGVAAIGHCYLKLLLCQVKMDCFDDIDDVRNPKQLESITIDRYTNDFDEKDRFIFPQKSSELIRHHLKNRLWLQANTGNLDIHRKYAFHTALSPEHILSVTFCPEGYWKQGTAPTPTQLDKVFVSFWDFMDHLTITEEPNAGNKLEPGETLRGERKALQEEFERSQRESKDFISGW